MSATKEHDQIEAGQRGQLHPISWLNMPGFKPETWNPIVGCSKVSPGCDNCYAEKQAFIRAFNPNTPQYKSVVVKHPLDPRYRQWNGQTRFVDSMLLKPRKWKTPRIVFVCSMGDLFHESVPFETIECIIDQAAIYEGKHIFIILTKRPERMAEYFKEYSLNYGLNKPISNVWLGVTAENQEQANNRIPILLSIPAAKRFVSIEPMLGPVELGVIHHADAHIDALNGLYNSYPDGKWTQKSIEKLDWVICGGESGPKARPMHPDWVRSLRDQCQEANTPFFFKQWGTWCPEGTVENYHFLNSSKEVQMGNDVMTKKPIVRNHDTLDGKQYHNWPIDQAKCKIGSQACVYHACMDDGCQKQHMLKVKNYGLGDCEKPEKINL